MVNHIPKEDQERILAFWEKGDEDYLGGLDEYTINGVADIYGMCDFAVSGCRLDLDIDDPELRRLAIQQAKIWGVSWTN